MTSEGRSRRTFLRLAAGLGGVSAFGGLAGCVDDANVDLDDTDAGDEPRDDPLALRSGVEIGVAFTALGGQFSRSEVNPADPDGGRLVTVEGVDPGEEVMISWRETVERETTPTSTTDAGVGTETPTPRVELVERTGTITASGLAGAHESYLPMFWDEGATATGTSAMWLSREAYRELAETRETAWSPDPLTRITWVGEEAKDRIHTAVEDVGEDDVILEAEPEFGEYDLTVDGQRSTVRTIEAHDSFGNEYVILANEDNPLVVEFTYNALSVGLSGFDTALWTLIKAVYSGYRVVSIDG